MDGKGCIDFCLIDTSHLIPGEILDFLMILPYLKDNATVVFHDVKLHTYTPHRTLISNDWFMTNNVLINAIKSNEKILLGKFDINVSPTAFPNIEAIKSRNKN